MQNAYAVKIPVGRYPRTERVTKLRERALRAIDTHAMWYQRSETNADDRYGWDDRQLLSFYKAWLRHRDAPTTLLRRTLAEADMIASEPVIISGDDLICGQPNVTALSDAERKEFEEYRTQYIHQVPQVLGRTGHMGLRFEKLLELGIEGILSEIDIHRQKLDENKTLEYTEKTEFYDCCEVQLRALLTLEDRYAAEARSRGFNELAELIERVPRKPARTFREALQSMHFYSFILRDLFSCGRPDRYLINYYRKDIAEGKLTEEAALELIDCWNLQYIFYTRPTAAVSYIVGGLAPDGTPVCNELTWLFLQSIEHVRLAYPSVGLGYFKGMDENLLAYACELLSQNLTHPAIFNDDAIPASLHASGLAMEHARNYINSTCVEITPIGCSGFWATSPYHSCPKMLMDLLGTKRDFKTIEELKSAYWSWLFSEVKQGQIHQNYLQLERMRNGGESPLAACLVDDCLARGKGIDQGGALYNHVLPDFIGATNTIDAIADIEQLVFKEKKLSLDELYEILCNNFSGHEDLRQYIIQKCPHFGNNEAKMDAWGAEFYQKLVESCPKQETLRGGKVIPGAFAFMMHEDMGKVCMATPDGRLAGEAFNGGSDPVSGRDIKGPTASLLSTTTWDQRPFLGGIAVNMRLNLSGMTEDKMIAVKSVIKTFMARNGFELQVNAVSPETLENAMREPEKYADLLVRIGGYSDFFVRQSPQLQREILARSYGEL